MSDPVIRIAEAMKKRASSEVNGMIQEGLAGIGLTANPEPDDGPFVEEVEEDVEMQANNGDDDYEEGISLAFEDADADANLQAAASAYRILGGMDLIVAQHPGSKRAFFGTEEELDEYAKGLDLADDEWDVYDTADKIMALPYDEGSMRETLKMLRENETDNARKQFEDFHWGDQPGTMVVKEIEGVNGPLTFLGVARRIEYYSVKDGEPAEYYHEFGEESGEYPSLYSIGEKTIVIHGANTVVTPRGIVD